MRGEISDDIVDEAKFLAEQDVPSTTISQMLGLSLDDIDRITVEERDHSGLGRINSVKT